MEGYGVDAYLYLPVLGRACETLPERVRDFGVISNGEEGTEEAEEEDTNFLGSDLGGCYDRNEDFWTPQGVPISRDTTGWH